MEKAKRWSGWESAWEHGTKLLAAIVILGSLSGCAYLDRLLAPTDPMDAEGENELVHPKKPNRWETQAILLSNEMPDDEDMKDCIDQIHEMGKFNQSEDELINAKKRLQRDIVEDEGLYHWCFYRMVEVMDNELVKNQGTYQQKLDIFDREMEGLWVLARAMDELPDNVEEMPYFSYLRSRYIELSRTLFGRNLDVISLPMDLRPDGSEKMPKAPEENGAKEPEAENSATE